MKLLTTQGCKERLYAMSKKAVAYLPIAFRRLHRNAIDVYDVCKCKYATRLIVLMKNTTV